MKTWHISWHYVKCVIKQKEMRKLDKWGEKEKLKAYLQQADEQCRKVMSLNNRKISTKDQTQDLGGFCFSLKTCQQWSHWKGGCPEAILKEGKRGEKNAALHKNWT